MNQYRFARLYMRFLILAAVLAVVAGLGLCLLEIQRAINADESLSSLKSGKCTLDTASVGREMRTAYDLVNPILIANGHKVAPPPSSKGSFLISSTAVLNPEQREDFLNYLNECQSYVKMLKSLFMDAFDSSVGAMTTAAKNALPSGSAASPASAPRLTTMSCEHLFQDGTLLPSHLESLQAISTFLRDKTSFYTPSPEAAALSAKAAGNLDAILAIMMREANVGENMKLADINNEIEKTPETEKVGTDKSQLVLEFIGILQKCRETASGVTRMNWQVDAVLSGARKETEQAQASHKASLSEAGQSVSRHTRAAVISLFAGLVAGILFLAFYDFMLALLDTAANTRRMAELLAGKQEDRNAPDNNFRRL